MVFDNINHSNLIKVMTFETMMECAWVLNETPQVVSNFFHKLINPRNAMKYVLIFKD